MERAGSALVVYAYKEDPLEQILSSPTAMSVRQGWSSRARDSSPYTRPPQKVDFYYWQGQQSESLSVPPAGYRYPNLYEVTAFLHGCRATYRKVWFPAVVKPHAEDTCNSVRDGNPCPHRGSQDFLAARICPEGVISLSPTVSQVFRVWPAGVYLLLVPLDSVDRNEGQSRFFRGMRMAAILALLIVLAIMLLR